MRFPSASILADPARGRTSLVHLPSQRLPKLEARPEQADLHRGDGTMYDLCDVTDCDFLDVPEHEDRSGHWIQTPKAVLQYMGHRFLGTPVLAGVSPNEELMNHQLLIRIGAPVEEQTALSPELRESSSYRNRHELKPDLFVSVGSIQV